MFSISVIFSFCSFQGLFHVLYRNPQLQQPILDMFFNQVQRIFFLSVVTITSLAFCRLIIVCLKLGMCSVLYD